jgi:hypothetical protein
MIECPRCREGIPGEGTWTATYNGITHRARSCALTAARHSYSVDDLTRIARSERS